MKVTITEPCVIEYEGVLTIHPIPPAGPVDIMAVAQAIAAENGATRHGHLDVPHESESEYRQRLGLPPSKGNHYPATRKTRRRHMVGPCLYCGEMFRGQENQLYCSPIHKHRYYTKNPSVEGRRRKRGIVPPEQGLDISAGARGVDVRVVDR